MAPAPKFSPQVEEYRILKAAHHRTGDSWWPTMAGASPAVIIHPGRHVTWYGDDTQRSRAIAILNALLGAWGRRGGFYFSEKVKIPTYPHPEYPKPMWSWRELLDGKYPLAGLSVC